MRISDWSSDVCSSDLLSGTGIGDMLDILVVPTRRELKLEPGTIEKPGEGFRQRYSDEHAEPGYYRVKLETGVLAEPTVTERCGLHRYRFGQGPGHILIDFAHAIEDDWDKGIVVEDASLDPLGKASWREGVCQYG